MFRPFLGVVSVIGVLALGAGAAEAQQVIVYNPVVTTTYMAPATVTYSPVETVVAAAPTVVYSPPVVAAPAVTTYSPVVTTYTPVVTTYTPVVAAQPVIVRPKVYVPGQPVRNFFRAITP